MENVSLRSQMSKLVQALQPDITKNYFPLKHPIETFLTIFSILSIPFCFHPQTFVSQDGLTLVVIATFQVPHAPHG